MEVMQTVTCANRTVRLFLPAALSEAKACVCAVLPVADVREADEAAALIMQTSEHIMLCAVPVDWNRELSPWWAPRAFAKGDDFAGEGKGFLTYLSDMLLPFLRLEYSMHTFALCGYSLAGLFSLWAMMEATAFDGFASMSGSLWYDGFLTKLETDIIRSHGIMRSHGTSDIPVYLSLGDKEALSRSKRLAAVGACTEKAAQFLSLGGFHVRYDVVPGNHFADVPKRTADGILWVCNALLHGPVW